MKRVLNFITKTTSGMAHGLFATLIIGTIFATIGSLFELWPDNKICFFLSEVIGTTSNKVGVAQVLQILTGMGIGVGIALSLKLDSLKTITLGAVGEIASYFSMNMSGSNNTPAISNSFKIGDPLTIYLVCIFVFLLMKIVLRKKTSVDIILIPLFGITIGLGFALILRYPSIYVTYGIQWIISKATTAVPFVMGIVISVLMGMALTAPISSAAIAAVVLTGNLEGIGLASGAAVVGCSVQMLGFAIQSRKDNNIGQIISIGIGTSMLQFKNIIKKPIIWLPTIIVSAILGPISTCWLKIECMGASAGMGTAGLVGQIGTISSMGGSLQTWIKMISLEIIAPIVLVFLIDLLFRKLNLIKDGDLAIKREEDTNI